MKCYFRAAGSSPPTRFHGAFLKNDDSKIELDVINPHLCFCAL